MGLALLRTRAVIWTAVNDLELLTPREREVLAWMAQGRSNSAIAASMVVSDGAVEKQISSIFNKLDLAPDDSEHRRVLAVLAFLRN